MQTYRIVPRTATRVCKPTCAQSRNMFTTPFFPGHFAPTFTNDIGPLFRLLDSATNDLFPTASRGNGPARRHFTPRFDVREVGQTYELQGELPGIDQKHLDIEFVDERTLVIRGRTASETTTSNDSAPAKAVEATEPNDAPATSDAASDHSVSYRKPSVEEEDGYVDAGAESSATATEDAKTPNTEVAKTEAPKTEEPNQKYWVSERSVGEFERRFSFPGRVDQEAVKASLRNGILSVVVPKVVAKEARRIQIE